MQVDPIKPKLKAPGTKRLKLKYVELLSSSGFKFNLRRCNKGDNPLALPAPEGYGGHGGDKVGRCKLTPSNPS